MKIQVGVSFAVMLAGGSLAKAQGSGPTLAPELRALETCYSSAEKKESDEIKGNGRFFADVIPTEPNLPIYSANTFVLVSPSVTTGYQAIVLKDFNGTMKAYRFTIPKEAIDPSGNVVLTNPLADQSFALKCKTQNPTVSCRDLPIVINIDEAGSRESINASIVYKASDIESAQRKAASTQRTHQVKVEALSNEEGLEAAILDAKAYVSTIEKRMNRYHIDKVKQAASNCVNMASQILDLASTRESDRVQDALEQFLKTSREKGDQLRLLVGTPAAAETGQPVASGKRGEKGDKPREKVEKGRPSGGADGPRGDQQSQGSGAR